MAPIYSGVLATDHSGVDTEAVKLATKLYEDLRYRHESGLPIRRKRFEEVLGLYLGNLAQEVKFGT